MILQVPQNHPSINYFFFNLLIYINYFFFNLLIYILKMGNNTYGGRQKYAVGRQKYAGGRQKYAVGGFQIDSTISIPYEDPTPPHEIQMYRDMVTIYFGVIKKTMQVFSGYFNRSKMSNVKFSSYDRVSTSGNIVSRTMPTINYDQPLDGKLMCFTTGCQYGIHFFISNNDKLIITFGVGETYSKYYNTFKNIQDLNYLKTFLNHLKLIIDTKSIVEILLCGHSNGMSSATITSFILLYLKLNGEEFVHFCTLFNVYIQNNSKVIEEVDDPTKDQLFDHLNRVKSDWVERIQGIKIFVVGTGGIPVIFFTEEQFSTYYNLLNGRYLHLSSKINNQLAKDTIRQIESTVQTILGISSMGVGLLFLEQTVEYPIKSNQFDSDIEFYLSRKKFYKDKLKEISENSDISLFSVVDEKVYQIYMDFKYGISRLSDFDWTTLDRIALDEIQELLKNTIIPLFDKMSNGGIIRFLKKKYPSETISDDMTLKFIKAMELFAKQFEFYYQDYDNSNSKTYYNYFSKLDELVKILQKTIAPDSLVIDTITRPKKFIRRLPPIWGEENYIDDGDDDSFYSFTLSNFKMYVYSTIDSTTIDSTTTLLPETQYHGLINGSNSEYFINIIDILLDGKKAISKGGVFGYDFLFDDLFLIGHKFDYIGYQILANIFNNGLLSIRPSY